MTTLLTGATGFVGAAVARMLLSRGEKLRVLVRPTSNRKNIADLDVEIVEGDLLQPETLKPACENIQHLYHVAADYRIWTRHPDQMMRANIDGSHHLLKAATEAGAKKIVYTSSVAVLGIHKDGTPANEDSPVGLEDMVGVYKRSKFLAEQAVDQLIADGAPIVIVNPSTPIGPRDVKPTPTGRILVEAATGKMPAFVETGLNVAHVDDVAQGHLLAMDRGEIGQRYILGGDDLSLREILQIVCHHVDRKPPTISLPHDLVLPIAWVAEAWTKLTGGDEPFATVDGINMARKKMYFSSDKARQALGYQPRSGKDAIIDALDWFKAEGYLS